MSWLVKFAASPFKVWNAIADEVAKERRLTLSNGSGWASLFGRETASGKTVTLDAALQSATFWACVRVNAQAVASLPGSMYEKRANGSREKVDDPIAEVLSESPNADQTPLEFWEEAVAWLMVRGNAYSEMVMSGRTLTALQPMPASHCWPHRTMDGELVYKFSDRGKVETLPREKVFHIKGFGQGLKNRDEGLTTIAYGANSIGAALAASESAGKMFGNGLQASGVLTSDQTLDEGQRIQLQKIMDSYVGSTKAGKLMILEAGLKYEAMSLNPDDAQLLETRRFDVEEICRWCGTPPIIIGHAGEGQTMWGSGVEQILLSWLTLGVDPIADRIEARIKKQLIRPTGKRSRYFEFNREALLQMDSKAKASFLSTNVQNGLMTRNEGREKLNLPHMDGGDMLTAQTNLAPLSQLGKSSDANAARNAVLSWLGFDQKEHRNVETQSAES